MNPSFGRMFLITLGFGAVLTGCAQAPSLRADHETRALAPEASSGYQVKAPVTGQRAISVTANPLASQAAQRVLRAGGSAADAAIAAQWVLALVEPQSSGLGGGAVLLYHDQASNTTITLDGRETAPAAANDSLFVNADGKPLGYERAVVGGRAVGVPGVVAALELLHARFGKLPWARLFDDAIALAQDGFAVSPRLHRLIALDPFLRRDPVAAAYFYDPNGTPWPIGHSLRNPALAATLRAIAQQGAQAFYQGPIAQALVSKVRDHPDNPGLLTVSDVAGYRAQWREPVCGAWLRYLVCGMAPPSSGGIAVLQILGLMQALARERGPAPLSDQNGYLALGVHRFTEAARLAYADRDRYIADPQFANWPRGLLNADYLRQRAALIDDSMSMKVADAGSPPDRSQSQRDGVELIAESGTSHWSIADAAGNVIALTSTVESAFGSRQMVAGFLLNNQLTDFSFIATAGGQPVANRVEGGKRPRSSMAPTLVFERRADGRAGRWLLSVGSVGGAQIITHVARVLVSVLADGVDLQTALAFAHIGSRNGPTEIERDGNQASGATDALVSALKQRGHEPRLVETTSGLHGIVRHCGQPADRLGSCTLTGGADPRREGLALPD